MRIAFLSTRRTKPSYRFRVEKLLPYFATHGHECDTIFLAPSALRRLAEYRRLAGCDVVFLQKRLLSAFELAIVRRLSARLVYDLDDAVMFDSQGIADRRRQTRFAAIVNAADLVICGNDYLADQASAARQVVVIPTCIDAEAFHPGLRPDVEQDLVTIGWTGSSSTNRYLNEILPVLAQFSDRVRLKIISDTLDGFDFMQLGRTPYVFVPWTPANEISETATFDVGLMPLPDNAWTRGKCGFKALQYLALGIPAVCSPVGVNRDVVHDGIDGFLASTREEWFTKLARLIRDAGLRRTIGAAGRRRVEEGFALSIHGPRLVRALESTCALKRRSA